MRDRSLLSVEDMREVRARLGKLRTWSVADLARAGPASIRRPKPPHP